MYAGGARETPGGGGAKKIQKRPASKPFVAAMTKEEYAKASASRRSELKEKEEARAKSAHLNQGHIPDIARFDGVTPTLYEFKCYAFAFLRRALGRGSARGGSSPSTAEGHILSLIHISEPTRPY